MRHPLPYAFARTHQLLLEDDGRDKAALVKEFTAAYKELQRTSKAISGLDDIIAAQTQKHEALKTHKRGLMQQLFPSPEEVEA